MLSEINALLGDWYEKDKFLFYFHCATINLPSDVMLYNKVNSYIVVTCKYTDDC